MTLVRPSGWRLQLADDAVHVWTVPRRGDGDSVMRVLSSYRGCGEGPPVVARGAGKPGLGGWGGDLRFSVAHTSGVVVVAVARGREVGVDVERLGRSPWLSLPPRVLTPRELASLEGLTVTPADAFLRLWTRKEALLKAAGVGLALDPLLVEVSGAGEPAAILDLPPSIGPAARFRLVDLDLPGCAAALAVEQPLGSITMLSAVRRRRGVLTKSLPAGDLGFTARL